MPKLDMNKIKFNYFPNDDIIHILIKEGKEHSHKEIEANIIAEYYENNELIGIEILNAGDYLKQTLIEKYKELDTIQY